MTIRNPRYIVSILLAAAAGASLMLAVLVSRSDEAIAREQAGRYRSYLLADELRQSSDDLTRMVRTFAATSEQRYAEYFRQILDIRNGDAPRPEDYHTIYWDFVVATGQAPRPSGEPQALGALMREAGFTDDELALMDEAEASSNRLVSLETEAMNAMAGLYKDADGDYTAKGAPDPALARKLLYSEDYHKEKERIMRPIEQFFLTVDRRTAASIETRRRQREGLSSALIAVTGLGTLLGMALVVLVLLPGRPG